MRAGIAIGLVAVALSAGLAWAEDAKPVAQPGVTPYGDFCPLCSKYGAGRMPVAYRDAVLALESYFAERGMTVANMRARGRFIRADVFHGPKQIDGIIFDMRTGRIRSVY